MNDESDFLEQNTERLIRAGFGPEMRPDPAVREQTLRSLVGHIRTKRPATAFPVGILVILAGILVAMAVCLAGGVLAAEPAWPTGLEPLSLKLLVLTVALNVIWIPIASMLLVIRRHRHVC